MPRQNVKIHTPGDEGSKDYPTVPQPGSPPTDDVEHSKIVDLKDEALVVEGEMGEQPEIGRAPQTTHELLYDSYTPQERSQVARATHFLLLHSDIGDAKRLTGHKCVFRVLMVLQWLLLAYGFIMLALCAYFAVTGTGDFLVIAGACLSGALLVLAFVGFWPAAEYSRTGIYFYSTLLFLVLVAEIAIIVLAFATTWVEEYAAVWWSEADASSRANIEGFLECCGYNDAVTDSISEACTSGVDGGEPLEKTQPACFAALKGFLQGNIPFIVIMGFVMITQIGALIASCFFAGHLRRSVSYTSSDKYHSADRNLEGVLSYVNHVQPPAGKPGG